MAFPAKQALTANPACPVTIHQSRFRPMADADGAHQDPMARPVHPDLLALLDPKEALALPVETATTAVPVPLDRPAKLAQPAQTANPVLQETGVRTRPQAAKAILVPPVVLEMLAQLVPLEIVVALATPARQATPAHKARPAVPVATETKDQLDRPVVPVNLVQMPSIVLALVVPRNIKRMLANKTNHTSCLAFDI